MEGLNLSEQQQIPSEKNTFNQRCRIGCFRRLPKSAGFGYIRALPRSAGLGSIRALPKSARLGSIRALPKPLSAGLGCIRAPPKPLSAGLGCIRAPPKPLSAGLGCIRAPPKPLSAGDCVRSALPDPPPFLLVRWRWWLLLSGTRAPQSIAILPPGASERPAGWAGCGCTQLDSATGVKICRHPDSTAVSQVGLINKSADILTAWPCHRLDTARGVKISRKPDRTAVSQVGYSKRCENQQKPCPHGRVTGWIQQEV
ncbi:uncharacterized protein [Scyliorhinus torazame]|uniref:uncharacterized protein n=1 Tax=Scyliorhinus torazame TaxID=75743 RepID=UPI003B5C6576